MPDSEKRYHSVWVTGLNLLYLLSLFLPAITIPSGGSGWASYGEMKYAGYQCLLFLPMVLFYPPWWANPLFAIGILSLVAEKRRRAMWCGIAAAALALSTGLVVFRLLRGWMLKDSPIETVFPLGPGYFVWLSCMIGLACVAGLTRPESPSVPNAPSGS